MYHTTMLVDFSYRGTGTRTWQSQLNAAGRRVARRLGVHVVDTNALTDYLPPRTLHRDFLHPRPQFTIEMFNMALNAYRWWRESAPAP